MTIRLLLIAALALSACKTTKTTETSSSTTSETAPSADGLPCPGSMFGAAEWTADLVHRRHGTGMTAVAEVRSSLEQPIEVCGVPGQLAWLTALRCPDGSPAFANADQAHGARIGNLGFAGRCERPIDGYAVTCPSTQLTVHMDLYHCGPGESLL